MVANKVYGVSILGQDLEMGFDRSSYRASCSWMQDIFNKKPHTFDVDQLEYKARLITKGFSRKLGVNYNKKAFSQIVSAHMNLVSVLYDQT